MQKETYIWGAGHYGVLTALDLENKGIKIKGFIDKNAKTIKTRLGLSVLELEQLPFHSIYVIIAVQNKDAVKEIVRILSQAGLNKGKDFEFSKLVDDIGIAKDLQKLMNAQLFRGIIEDCEWLKYKSFAPGGWAMDNAALYTIFRILNDVKPNNILEFGLGQSSKMVHQYATFSQNTTALTIEHDHDWIKFFCSGIPKYINVNIKQFDKQIVKYNGFETLSYKNIEGIFIEKEYDFIIVDGPFGSEHFSRSQIIDIVKNGLPKQFCIFLDDSERNGESETIEAICKILNDSGILFLKADYVGEKNQHTIICSEDLKFLTSLK
jgi:hypothetical protein